eukprot:UC4_evm1s1067
MRHHRCSLGAKGPAAPFPLSPSYSPITSSCILLVSLFLCPAIRAAPAVLPPASLTKGPAESTALHDTIDNSNLSSSPPSSFSSVAATNHTVTVQRRSSSNSPSQKCTLEWKDGGDRYHTKKLSLCDLYIRNDPSKCGPNIRKWGCNYRVEDPNPENDHVYYLNPFGDLNPMSDKIPCRTKGVSSCQATGSGVKPAGYYMEEVDYLMKEENGNDGEYEYLLSYSGTGPDNLKDSCHKKFNRQTKIIFQCDETGKAGFGQPTFVEETPSCIYIFRWVTTLACLDSENSKEVPEVKSCMVYDPKNGDIYDLSSLTKNKDGDNSENYEAVVLKDDDAQTDNYRYLINVCAPLIDDEDTKLDYCEKGSGVCQFKSGPPIQAWSLGKPESPKWDPAAGGVYIEYPGGTRCEDVKDKNGDIPDRVTRINFECGSHTGFPVFQHEVGCYYVFNWRTSAACPQKTTIEEGKAEKCVITDSITQIKYDLTDLGKKPLPAARDKNDWEYHLNLCGSQHNSTNTGGCPPGTAICQVNWKSENVPPNVVGKSPGTISIRDGIGQISMKYEDGDKCQGDDGIEVSRSAVITFECHKKPEPIVEFLNEVRTKNESTHHRGCYYLFNIKTNLACSDKDGNDENPSCLVPSGDVVYDLTPLQGADVIVLDKTFSGINIKVDVCTREDKQGPRMEDGHGGSHMHIEYDVEKEYFDDDYFGDACEGKDVKVHIDFRCPEWAAKENIVAYNLGSPEIKEKPEECQYEVEWVSTAACPLRIAGGQSCKVLDPGTGIHIDLNPLRKEKNYVLEH